VSNKPYPTRSLLILDLPKNLGLVGDGFVGNMNLNKLGLA